MSLPSISQVSVRVYSSFCCCCCCLHMIHASHNPSQTNPYRSDMMHDLGTRLRDRKCCLLILHRFEIDLHIDNPHPWESVSRYFRVEEDLLCLVGRSVWFRRVPSVRASSCRSMGRVGLWRSLEKVKTLDWYYCEWVIWVSDMSECSSCRSMA